MFIDNFCPSLAIFFREFWQLGDWLLILREFWGFHIYLLKKDFAFYEGIRRSYYTEQSIDKGVNGA